MTHLDNYRGLEAKAADIGKFTGLLVSVEVAAYWSSGVQQVDHYVIRVRSNQTVSGPLPHALADAYIDGLRAGVLGYRSLNQAADPHVLEAPQVVSRG